MPADCWGAGSSQSTENQRAGCRGHKEAPEGAVRTRPSLLKRMSGPDTHPPPAVGCANGAFTASHYRISSCVMLPVRGTGILSRQKSAMAGGAFLSNLAPLGRRGCAIPLGVCESHASTGRGLPSHKPVSLSARSGRVPRGLLASGGEYSPGLSQGPGPSQDLDPVLKPRIVLCLSPLCHTSGVGQQGLHQSL